MICVNAIEKTTYAGFRSLNLVGAYPECGGDVFLLSREKTQCYLTHSKIECSH